MTFEWKECPNLPNPKWFIPLLIIFLFIVFFCSLAFAEEITAPPIWKVLMAEAVSEGYDGMYAVACVIRNRGGDLRGFMGAKRSDLDEFCNRQGKRHIEMAKRIETLVFKNNAKDITGKATHFENVGKYGTPYWAKEMVVTCKIGKHTFFTRR